MRIDSRKLQIFAWDTENDWNEECTEVYLVQSAFVGEHLREMIFGTDNIVYDRCAILNFMIDIAKQFEGTSLFYCANLKHEAELLKEGFKVIQNTYNIIYRRRESAMLEVTIEIDHKRQVVLRDVLAVYAGQSVKSLGKLFKLPKLDGFNFKAGWSKEVNLLDEEHQEYCFRDADITYLAAKYLHDNNLDGITVASVAWKGIKRLINGDNPKSGFFEQCFPRLTKEIDSWIRPAYVGGINYSDKDFVVPEDGILVHEDASSMYPTVCIFDELPFGLPYYCGKKRPSGLWISKGYYKLRVRDKRPDYWNIDKKVANEDGTITLTMTNIDYELLEYCYHVDYEVVESYLGFSSRVGLLKDWFLQWYEIKNEASKKGDLAQLLHAKYMLNSPTGRFGLRREMTDCMLGDDWVTIPKLDDNEEDVENEDSYLPYVVFITAQARKRLIQHSKLLDPLIHMDTDSTIGYRRGSMTVNVSAMGGWKVESRPVRIIEGGFKRYVEIQEDGSYTMACSGVPQKSDAKGCPIGMWIEILDNPEIIKEFGYELGNKHYVVKSEWLRKRLLEGGYNPDDVNTMKLMPKKAFGGFIYTETTMKLNDGLMLRWGK